MPEPPEAPGPSVDPDDYRRVVGHFATGICVVTTRADGFDHAMTVNALTSVSLDPVLVLICVDRTTRFHAAVLDAGEWAVSVLGADALDASTWFATKGRPLAGQLSRYPHSPGTATGLAVLDEAIAVLECRTWATYDGGDHTVVLGEVLAAREGNLSAPPLVYYHGAYRTLT